MKKKSPKILICGGGTGGHIYTAIAIADALKKRLLEIGHPAKFLFIGGKDRMEMEIVPKAGYDIKGFWISGLPKKLTKEAVMFPLKIISSYRDCMKIFGSFHPDVVIGTGGYVSGIPLYLAHNKKIHTFIQEQNVTPGYTNKKAGWNYAKKIFVAHEKSLLHFPKQKTILTGNPLRSKILSPMPDRKEAYKKFNFTPERPVILSIGGSQGARNINNGWIKGIEKLVEQDIQLLWQIGKNDFQKVQNDPDFQHPNICLNKFIDDMHMAYAAADIVVSRAGGLAISELAALGKPCILIPFSKAAQNHQTENAKYLVDKKSAIMIHDEEIQQKMVDIAICIVKNQTEKETLSKNILTISKPYAAQDIAEEIINFL
ncbi:MAG: undecaprenyldiphospho-muramoylpentapeptide beta-N-acetylglucosaminyltransferase [Flavobacteriales bacterium Tduv]